METEFLIGLFAGPLILLIASLPRRAANWVTRREALELELARLDDIQSMDQDEIERERGIALRKSKNELAAAGQATSGAAVRAPQIINEIHDRRATRRRAEYEHSRAPLRAELKASRFRHLFAERSQRG